MSTIRLIGELVPIARIDKIVCESPSSLTVKSTDCNSNSLCVTSPFTRIASGIITGLAGFPEDRRVLVSPPDCAKAVLLPTTIAERNTAKMPATCLCVWTRFIATPINLEQLSRIIQAYGLERLPVPTRNAGFRSHVFVKQSHLSARGIMETTLQHRLAGEPKA